MLISNSFILAFLVVYARSKPISNQENQPFIPRDLRCSNSTPTVTCPQQKEASGYALSIDVNEFRPNEEIKVMVHRTSCPMSNDSPLPRWYQLEAYWSQEANGEEVKTSAPGKLKLKSFYRTDLYQCENATRVLFYPCEAAWFDFPGRYTWKAPNPDSDFLPSSASSVCFRLTVLEENSMICEIIEKCISYVNESSTDSEFVSITVLENGDEDDSYFDEIDDIAPITDSENQNDTNVQQSTEFSSDCIENRDYRISINSSWIPQCDCKGYYRFVQCKIEPELPESLTCWCSSQFGAQLSSSLSTVDCSKFELSCG